MKAQFEVSAEVWGRVKVASMLACKSIGEVLEPVLDKAFPGRGGSVDTKGSALGERALRAVEADAPKPMQVSNPAVPTIKQSKSIGGVPVGPLVEPEVKTSKCRKCFESFPVDEMVTEPKTGKLYCANCVENMRNGQ